MPKNSTYIFNGSMMSASPLTTCGPTASQATDNSLPKPVPVTNTGRGQIMYMPAAGFRSKLRGACTELVREALVKRSMRLLTLQDAQLLRLGGVKQGGSEAAIPYEKFQDMLTANPVLSLFGASTPWVDGKLMVGHIFCTEAVSRNFQPMVVDGVRAAMLRREPKTVEFLTPDALTEYALQKLAVKNGTQLKAQVKTLKNDQRKAKTEEEKESLAAQIKVIEKVLKDAGVVSEQMPLAGYEAIPPHSAMEQRMRLLNATETELGGLLCSIERFAQTPLLGAHLAHGCGEIEGSWEVLSEGKLLGTVTLSPWVGIELTGPHADVLEKAMASFKSFVAEGDLKPWTPDFIANPAPAEEVAAEEFA